MVSKGIIMYNRGDKMLVRALTALYSLRKYYQGNITFYVEPPCPCMEEFIKSLEHFNCNVVLLKEKHEYKTLIMKNSLFENPPYDKTLWLDTDTIIESSIDKMFDYLDEHDADMCIPHFCGWISNGRTISKRINRFHGIIDEKYMAEALKPHPAINTGVLSFRKSEKWSEFVRYWTDLAHKGSQKHIFISDEVVCQILYPSMSDWGLKYYIAPTDYNVSVLHDHGKSKSPKISHFHGDKHVLSVPTCDKWKKTFNEMREKNIANINFYLQYADKRLKKYLGNDNKNGIRDDVTIVTACDPYYVEILKHTFENWRKYKGIDKYPVIVFVNGIDLNDERLKFLKLPNVKVIPWSMSEAETHREEMLSAFVLGTAKYVETEYWLKLDADSYATDSRPFITDEMKKYAFCGHKWGYSRPEHIKALDAWAKKHWKVKLRTAKPMMSQGKSEGNRFYHDVKRTISYIQLHKTKFTRFCVKCLGGKTRLPVPSQDTYMFYICNRFDPHLVGIMNFKRNHGFTQGRGKLGAEHIKQKLIEVDASNDKVGIVKNAKDSSGEQFESSI